MPWEGSIETLFSLRNGERRPNSRISINSSGEFLGMHMCVVVFLQPGFSIPLPYSKAMAAKSSGSFRSIVRPASGMGYLSPVAQLNSTTVSPGFTRPSHTAILSAA